MTPPDFLKRVQENPQIAVELLEALEWAMKAGRLTYVHRLKHNAEHCDRIDAVNALIADCMQSPIERAAAHYSNQLKEEK